MLMYMEGMFYKTKLKNRFHYENPRFMWQLCGYKMKIKERKVIKCFVKIAEMKFLKKQSIVTGVV